MEGVVRTCVGYAGGTTADPTYHRMGDHTESIQIDFDPEIVSYEDLLKEFLTMHDPSYPSGSVQYASLVLYSNEAQHVAADRALDAFAARTGRAAQTRVLQLKEFHPAEGYHQKYYWHQFAKQWVKKTHGQAPDWRSTEFSHWLDTGAIDVCALPSEVPARHAG